MSILKKTIPVPASTREYTESIQCDLCHEVYKKASEEGGGVNWDGDYGTINTTCVSIGDGYHYLECHDVDYRDYHICCECFKTKLEPWLKSQGAIHTDREISW